MMTTSGRDENWFLEYEERRIDLREGEITLGRSRGCGVVLRDPSVSRGHALLSMRQGRVTLQDLRSSNGTYVNGKRLDKETVVEEGDRLVIGETELFLRRVQGGKDGPDGSAGPAGRRIETGEVSLFCPACGLPIHGSAGGRCPGCGAELSLGRLPRLSEAVGLGEILPVGEALGAAPSDSWDRTSFRQRAARAATGSREVAIPDTPVAGPRLPPDPPDPVSTAETRQRDAGGAVASSPPAPPLALPMSVREAERRPSPTRERSGVLLPMPTVTPVPPPAAPAAGLWSRLAGFFRGRKTP
ncbi:MAG TPA: FHA domain-containing protein [Thermoanaerobaculia bacterium]|jgi:pilus assembly protein CpaF|nr:FHA domain-containing protein [Thermoanaerobaculia bacterium]